MGRLTFKDAVRLVENGQAHEPVARFIGNVKFAAVTGNSAAISLDDALVTCLVLSRLLETAEGRKLMKKPKRKNLQYRAEDFGFDSEERRIARRVASGEMLFNEGLKALEDCFETKKKRRTPDRERTLTRLLEDLLKQEQTFDQWIGEALAACGWDGDTDSSKEAAIRALFGHLGYPVPDKP